MKNKINGLLVMMLFVFSVAHVQAQSFDSSVVINEVAWAGTESSSSDEWIELYNSTSASIDLSGWSLWDDDSEVFTFGVQEIPAYGYLLIEDSETATAVDADLIIGLSLANSGDVLELKDASGNIVDVVNASGGAWYAGSSTDYSTMERIDAAIGDVEGNFDSSLANGGTPKAINSLSDIPSGTAVIELNNQIIGDQLEVIIAGKNMNEVFSYGFNLNYNDAALNFVGATKGDFLSESESVDTSFLIELKNGVEGELVIAEARMQDQKAVVSGDGDLVVLTFDVISDDNYNFVFDSSSFVSGLNGDLSVVFDVDGDSVPSELTGLKVEEGEERYRLKLSWDDKGADNYLVYRRNQLGDFVELGQVTENQFVDDLMLIPGINYEYQVIAMNSNQEDG
ncbi:hypothetical protein GF376_01285, partial [Candidatus Peregrinibacteria bacterium]|nr:hypothetical protein [Candidatus Peregrinibacteria bacterium]